METQPHRSRLPAASRLGLFQLLGLGILAFIVSSYAPVAMLLGSAVQQGGTLFPRCAGNAASGTSVWRHGAITSLRAVMEPPVLTRPPDVGDEVVAKSLEWTECLINDPMKKSGDSEQTLRVETWVFRTEHYGDFERFLKIRGFENTGQEATLTCRERQVDPEVRCAECMRLLRGGYYSSVGVAVQAYPPQKEAVGCLSLSKLIEMEWSGGDDAGGWDGGEPRQTAFCNSVNARFESVKA